jgi:hypothetical protein
MFAVNYSLISLIKISRKLIKKKKLEKSHKMLRTQQEQEPISKNTNPVAENNKHSISLSQESNKSKNPVTEKHFKKSNKNIVDPLTKAIKNYK